MDGALTMTHSWYFAGNYTPESRQKWRRSFQAAKRMTDQLESSFSADGVKQAPLPPTLHTAASELRWQTVSCSLPMCSQKKNLILRDNSRLIGFCNLKQQFFSLFM